MNRTDAEMMEAEASTAAPHPESNDGVLGFLTLARRLVAEGKPSQAMQAVVMVLRARGGGDEAVFQFMHRAREMYRKRLQEDTAADQLASLFAECAIAEAEPAKAEPSPPSMNVPLVAPDAHGDPILAETGRMQIVLDAFADGSSFICLQCGGLVSNHRKDEHYAYWCCKM